MDGLVSWRYVFGICATYGYVACVLGRLELYRNVFAALQYRGEMPARSSRSVSTYAALSGRLQHLNTADPRWPFNKK